jgi:hypothetical protein
MSTKMEVIEDECTRGNTIVVSIAENRFDSNAVFEKNAVTVHPGPERLLYV